MTREIKKQQMMATQVVALLLTGRLRTDHCLVFVYHRCQYEGDGNVATSLFCTTGHSSSSSGYVETNVWGGK